MNEQLVLCNNEKAFVEKVLKFVTENRKYIYPGLEKDFEADALNYWNKFKNF